MGFEPTVPLRGTPDFEFHANKPNSKWVTGISYIHTKQGVPVPVDLYDSIVAYKTGTQQTVNLVTGHHPPGHALKMIDR